MRKEVIFAIIIGALLGFVIIYGLQLANQSSGSATTPTTTPSPTPSQTAQTPTPAPTFNITFPEDNSIVTTSTIKVTGTSYPNSQIVINSNQDEVLGQTDANGQFSLDIKLTGGENNLEISTINPTTQKLETRKITVIFTTAKID